MRREVASAALGGVLAATAAQTTFVIVDVFYWGAWMDVPQYVKGTVVDVSPSATTLELTCEYKNSDLEERSVAMASNCGLPQDPMTVVQGPSTYSAAMTTSKDGFAAYATPLSPLCQLPARCVTQTCAFPLDLDRDG